MDSISLSAKINYKNLRNTFITFKENKNNKVKQTNKTGIINICSKQYLFYETKKFNVFNSVPLMLPVIR